ncbi:MAG: hypothetical protein ACI4WX_13825 [Aristaeellaceae bacterium]
MAVLIADGIRHQSQTAYFAGALWSLLQYASHGDSTFPAWGEVFPDRKRDEEETAEEIKARIIREMRR